MTYKGKNMEIILKLKVNLLLLIFVLTIFLPNFSTCCSNKREDIKSITTVSSYEATKNTLDNHNETHVELTNISTSKTIKHDKTTTVNNVTTAMTNKPFSELGSSASTDSARLSQSTDSHDSTRNPAGENSTKATSKESEASDSTITLTSEGSTVKNDSVRVKYAIDSGKYSSEL